MRFHRHAGGQQRRLGVAGAMDRHLAIRLAMHDQDRCGVLTFRRQRLRRDQGAGERQDRTAAPPAGAGR